MPYMTRRISTVALTISLATASLPASAQWWNPLAPTDYEECAEQAAKDGKTSGGLAILLKGCQDKYQARRNPKGKGYVYYDSRIQQWISVAGPSLTAEDRKRIEQAYQDHLRQEQEKTAQRQELRRQEQETRRKEWDQYSARVSAAEPQVSMTSQRVDCVSSAYCARKTVALTLKNASKETITGVSIGWAFSRSKVSCPSQFDTSKTVRIDISPGSSNSVIFEITDGPAEGPYWYCLKILSIGLDQRPQGSWTDEYLQGGGSGSRQ